MTQHKVLVVAALSGFLLSIAVGHLRAQKRATAQISGVASDPTGAVVPNAKVTATQTATGRVRTTVGGPVG